MWPINIWYYCTVVKYNYFFLLSVWECLFRFRLWSWHLWNVQTLRNRMFASHWNCACVRVMQTCYFNGWYVISIHGTAYRCTYNLWGFNFLTEVIFHYSTYRFSRSVREPVNTSAAKQIRKCENSSTHTHTDIISCFSMV